MSRTKKKEEEEVTEMEVDEQEFQIVELDHLQSLGINVSDIKKLKAAGIYSISGVLMHTLKELTEIKGMSEAKALKICEICKKESKFGFQTGMQVLRQRGNLMKITTGCTAFDELLGGGIEARSITEVFGEFRTGKTQLCHTLAVTAQLPEEQGGGNGKVIFIDTEGTFRPDRIQAIAERFGLDPSAVLENISYARAYTHEQQMEFLGEAAAHMIEQPYSLVIVDSCTALFRVDYSGRGQLAERQQKLAKFLSGLTKIAEEFNVACVISNQVVSDPGGGMTFVADPKKPIGGHIMAHASTTRLYLRKGRGEQRICKIYDSPSLPESDCVYQLSEGGISNVAD